MENYLDNIIRRILKEEFENDYLPNLTGVVIEEDEYGSVELFGDPNMRIKKSSPSHRKSFRARHNCQNPGPKTSARYWSCKAW